MGFASNETVWAPPCTGRPVRAAKCSPAAPVAVSRNDRNAPVADEAASVAAFGRKAAWRCSERATRLRPSPGTPLPNGREVGR